MQELRESGVLWLGSGDCLAGSIALVMADMKRSDKRTDTSTRLDHAARLAEQASYRSDFDRALCQLLLIQARTGATGLRDGRRAAMIRALDGRANWTRIRDWRKGKARTPQWAMELVAHKLTTRAKADLDSIPA